MAQMVILTDNDIDNLIRGDKFLQASVLNNSKWKIVGAHRKKEVPVSDMQGNDSFAVFWRQTTYDALDFTVGLSYKVPDSTQRINLIRCNGKSHTHTNKLEGNKLEVTFHIHRATEKYQNMGFKAEDHAETTDKYSTMDEAFKYLCLLTSVRIGDRTQTGLDSDW